MLLVKPVKKVFAKIFPTVIPDLKDRMADIPIGHFNFNFKSEEIDVKFFMQKEWATAYFAACLYF